MRFTVFLFASFIALASLAQEKRDIGISAGASYYLGDYNPSLPFRQVRPTVAILFRYNASNYYSFRGSAGMAALAGSYNPSDFYLPGATPAFGSQIFLLDGITEINFLPFDSRLGNKANHSPYVSFGAGITLLNGSPLVHVPVGLGYKYAFGNRITVSAEWSFRKTFTDRVDGYPNPNNGSGSLVHNNDWYSAAGISIMYRLYSKKALCPVYQ